MRMPRSTTDYERVAEETSKEPTTDPLCTQIRHEFDNGIIAIEMKREQQQNWAAAKPLKHEPHQCKSSNYCNKVQRARCLEFVCEK